MQFKKMQALILLPVFLCLFTMGSCQKSDATPDDAPKEIRLSSEQQLLLDESRGFAFDLFREMAAIAGSGENVFMSPLSVSLALAMAYNGAEGSTREAMRLTMQLPDMETEEINKAYSQLIKDLVSVDTQVVMNIANSVWYLKGFYVSPPFLEANATYYNAEVRELDFSHPDAVTIINNWVAEKTNHLIDKIIERVTRETVMILINAIYFNGQWKISFSEEATIPLPFFPEGDKPVNVPTMILGDSFNYLSNELFAVAELPYGRGNYSMLVFLPHPEHGVQDVIDALDQQLWGELKEGLSVPHKLSIQLPKFKFAFSQQLNEALINMGMEVAFSPGLADFSGINPHEQIFISEAIHKAFVDVNEKGTEAAAVTAIVFERTSVDPDAPVPFHVNRPFVFLIREKYTNAVIFAGKVMQPVIED